MQQAISIFDDNLKAAFIARANRIDYKPIEIVEEVNDSINDRLEFFGKQYSDIKISGIITPNISKYHSDSSSSKAIVSVLEMQYINDVASYLNNFKAQLSVGDLFICIFLGGSTFKSLRELLEKNDQSILGGVSPKVAPMINVKDAGMLMQKAGFKRVVADTESISISYNKLTDVLLDIRSLGISNCLVNRSYKYLGKNYKRAIEDDIALNTISLNYEIITLTGFA